VNKTKLKELVNHVWDLNRLNSKRRQCYTKAWRMRKNSQDDTEYITKAKNIQTKMTELNKDKIVPLRKELGMSPSYYESIITRLYSSKEKIFVRTWEFKDKWNVVGITEYYKSIGYKEVLV